MGTTRTTGRAAAAVAAVCVVVLALVVPLGGALPSTTAAGTVRLAEPDGAGRPPYTFVSAPDLFNGDLGDVRSAPTWRRGMPNSWNAHWAANVENIFGQLAAFDADDYLVAGDLVEGQWHLDKRDDRVFGTGDETVTRAGNVYYPRWKSFWRAAGVDPARVHEAVGDHEVGDNLARAGGRQYRLFPRFKRVFARHFTLPGGKHRYRMHPPRGQHTDTAYATWLAPDVLLVTVDVFASQKAGIAATVEGEQLAWLRRVLARTEASDTVIVQGHVPVLGPVRRFATSAIRMRGGEDSPFWKLLRARDVDLYLSGEVHADTAVQRAPGDPLQVSHGGLAKYGTIRFLTGSVADDGTVSLVSRQIRKQSVVPTDSRGNRLWSTNKTMPWKVVLDPFSTETGSLTLTPDGRVTESSGHLALNPDLD